MKMLLSDQSERFASEGEGVSGLSQACVESAITCFFTAPLKRASDRAHKQTSSTRLETFQLSSKVPTGSELKNGPRIIRTGIKTRNMLFGIVLVLRNGILRGISPHLIAFPGCIRALRIAF